MANHRSHLSFILLAAISVSLASQSANTNAQAHAPGALATATSARQAAIEEKFLAVPSAKLAGEQLKTLTAEPHMAATPEDRKTADYVAEKFRAAGLKRRSSPIACC